MNKMTTDVAMQAQKSRSVLIVLYEGMGSITCRVRGLIYAEPLRKLGWTVDFVEYSAVTQSALVEQARPFDLVYLLKIPSIALVRALHAQTRARLIFDLTDALWMPHHRWNQWQDLESILSEVDAVFSDNEFVADYGRLYNARVHVIAPCSQVEEFDAVRTSVAQRDDGILRIGWVGTASTLTALEVIREPLNRIFARHANLHLRVLALNFNDFKQLPAFQFDNWSVIPQYDEALMIREVLELDVGLFPPPCGIEDYRIRGALKGMVYMTGALPTVCQRGGTLDSVIEDGVNGMLADSPQEWEDKLEVLVRSADLRRDMGARALETVRRSNSLDAITTKLHQAFEAVLGQPDCPSEGAASGRSILIVCSHFWPSSGGLESRMGQFSRGLLAVGYRVVVLTQALPGRDSNNFHGVEIQSVEQAHYPAMIRASVAGGSYHACVLVQDPLGVIIWSLEGLTPPPQTRVLIQPIINEDGYARWKDHPSFGPRLANILRTSGIPLVMTKSGPDTRFMQTAGLQAVYLPNATEPPPIAGDFRAEFGIATDEFLILHVANVYWVKNHIGLINALQDLPPNWRLVMVGNPSGEPDCVQAVQEKLSQRPDILFIPGLSREWTSAAMEAADVVVLASKGEGSPITILEAMSHSKPWIATPECGAANDHLGGFICALPMFRSRLQALAESPQIRAHLGGISLAHWQQCYSWPVAMQGWIDLIEHGRLKREFVLDASLIEQMESIRMQLAPNSNTTEAIRGSSDPLEVITQAQSFVVCGQPAQAISLYRDWLSHNFSGPRFAIEYNLGTVLENLSDFASAERAYQNAAALAPEMELPRTALQRVRQRAANTDRTYEH